MMESAFELRGRPRVGRVTLGGTSSVEVSNSRPVFKQYLVLRNEARSAVLLSQRPYDLIITITSVVVLDY